MRNKRVKRQSIPIVNLYGLGSQIKQGWQGMNSGQKASAIGGAASGLIGAASGGTETKAGNIMGGIGSTLSSIPTPFTQIAGAGLSVVGGLVNAAFGSKMNEEFIAQTESNIENQENTQFDASTNEDLLSEWGDYSNLANVRQSQVGKDGWFSNKAKRKTRALNRQINEANNRALAAFGDRVDNVDAMSDLKIAANFAALGGHLLGDGGGIHIKKKNRGKFTDYCGGKVTSACIQRGKHSKSAAVRKRATFAQNARGWHHAFGGELGTNGADWTNGVNFFDIGGTHEENPNQGIPQGVDQNGVPNLVEEGEVKFQDYIFSNRIKADKDALEMVGLPTKDKGKTFAKLARKASEESKERPNDPISMRGLTDAMMKLQAAQEMQRERKEDRRFAKGGKLYAKGGFEGLDKDMEDIYNQGATALLRQWDNPGLSEESIVEDFPVATGSNKTKASKGAPTWMRYAPAMGGALGALAASLTPVDAPNYGDADSILRARKSVGFTPLTQKLSYKPFDRNFYINKLNAQSGATRRALANAAGGNRGALVASLIGADYNAQNQMGDLFRQAEEYNQAQRERVAGFNRQTDQANAQMGIQTGMFNSQMRQQAAAEAARMRMIENQRYRADRAAKRDAIAANLTNFLESLGGIGEENYWRNAIDSLRRAGVYQAGTDLQGSVKRSGAKGGKLKLKL